MKKILPLLALVALIGCTKEDLISSSDYSTPITYSITNVSDVTRASLTTNDNVAEKFPVMNVRAILTESNMNKSPNTTVFTSTLNTATAKSDEVRYWPEEYKDYVFYSYPVNSFVGEKINFHYDAMEARITVDRNTEDIVVARTAVSRGQKVNFEYKHIFTAVSVVYKKVQYGHKITAIRIVDTPKRGLCKVYKQDDGSTYVHWAAAKFDGTTTLEDTNLKYATHNGTDLTDGVAKFMTIPTKNSGANIKVEVDIDGKTVSATCGCKKAGDHVTFYVEDNLTITQEDGAYCDAETSGNKVLVDAYITGEYNTTTTVDSKPMDFILVLDYSGSMNDSYSVHSGEASTYQRVTSSGTTTQSVNKRIYALESAVYSFLDKVKADEAASGMKHRVSIIQFQNPKWPRVNTTLNSERKLYIKEGDSRYLAPYSPGTVSGDNANYTTTSVIAQFAEVNDASILTMKKAMSAITWAGCTAADYGMHLASLQMGNCRTKDSNGKDVGKCIIVFSDGKPTHASGAILSDCVIPGYYEANVKLSDDNVIDGAIDFAQVCKNKGAEIFTIYTGSSDEKNNKFLEGVATDASHFQDASSSSLSDAFDRIVTETTTVTPDIDVHGEAYVQVQFSNALKNVKYKGCYGLQQTGYDSTSKKISFSSTKTNLSGITCTSSNGVFKATGYDFGKYFCGKGANGKGMKLVLEFEYEKNSELSGSNKYVVYPSGLYKDSATPLYMIDDGSKESPSITL